MTAFLLGLVGLWILLAAVWLAAWPLIGRNRAATPASEIERREIEAEKARLLGEIHDLELDQATGKLSDEDFAAIEARLKARAVEVMRRLDAAAAPRMEPRP